MWAEAPLVIDGWKSVWPWHWLECDPSFWIVPIPVCWRTSTGLSLGGEIAAVEDDWVVILVDGLRLAFQLADDFAPPTWPTGERPQQFHIDMTVDDVEAVEREVLALGATKHAVQPGEATGDTFRVYLDPAGHPFCLCWD